MDEILVWEIRGLQKLRAKCDCMSDFCTVAFDLIMFGDNEDGERYDDDTVNGFNVTGLIMDKKWVIDSANFLFPNSIRCRKSL